MLTTQDADEQYKQSKRELDEVVSQMESLVSFTCTCQLTTQ